MTCPANTQMKISADLKKKNVKAVFRVIIFFILIYGLKKLN